MILLDTHVLIWLDQGNKRLGRATRSLIDDALQEGALAVSAISFWETGMLIEKGRLRLEMDPLTWRNDLLNSGLVEITVDGIIAINSTRLSDFHGDPADRLIASTAMHHAASLVTADERIMEWSGPVRRLDARL